MKRIALVALATLASTQVLAVGRMANVSIIDRDTSQVLQTHFHRGEYWVEGRPGARYAIQVSSRSGQRLLAVTSVDGVNVVTGETAAFDQRGYVFDPWSGYDIAGWRKSNSQIAAFTFTSLPRSYAARTGRPDNVGVIGVALFREYMPQPQPIARGEEAARRERPAATPAPSLGTGHGHREHSEVRNVDFNREQQQPNEIIRIRYDSHDNLVAMGVIRLPSHRPEAFPGDPRFGYVPDP